MNRPKKKGSQGWVATTGAILLAVAAWFVLEHTEFGRQINSGSQGAPAGQNQGPVGNLPSIKLPGGTRSSGQHWSNTSPSVNLRHVFEGEINRSGKATGFHSRPGGSDPSGAKMVSIKNRPNRVGVYTANVKVRDGNQWKTKFSTFFPDNMSEEQVVASIVHAYRNSKNPKKQPWSGPSGKGFEVQGYTSSKGGINTAFPIYRKNQ